MYDQAKKTLEKYFNPQSNVPYERLLFRNMAQNESETIEQYITRLRQKAVTCNSDKVDEEIRDQVINKCISHTLGRKLLQKGGDLTLADTREIGRALEESERQASSIEGKQEVNKISSGDRPRGHGNGKYSHTNKQCFACGYKGHIAKDSMCPARFQQCHQCGYTGHFESRCKTKSANRGRGNYRGRGAGRGRGQNRQNSIRTVQEDAEDIEETTEFAFNVSTNNIREGKIDVETGGVKMKMLIDLGATCNVTDRSDWERLKREGIKCKSRKSNKELYVYGGQKLEVAGSFTATVKTTRKSTQAEFIVIEGQGQPLLSKNTAEELGVIKMGLFVNAIQNNNEIFTKYPEAFEGLGKLKDFQLKIPIDHKVPPVAQKLRRVPYQLRGKLEKKLDELEELNIIEKVTTSSSWISPVVIVPKKNGDVRLCIDMRQANTAVKRIKHPIPTIDEVLQDLNNSTMFSKLDIKWAYHQMELDQESRDITTFVMHKGLYRYTRLLFGVSCAPEMYQTVMQNVLQECEGVHNIMDDIIVHGSSAEEHNERLSKVVKILAEKGLNREKCQLNKPKIEFMGHVLSSRGVGPADVKVKAVVEAREPQTATEVRSFLGLVNYSARYIPDLATISAPLRELTKKKTEFVWGKEQQESFDAVKKRLARAETLGYYQKDAPTKVITDASPVGLGAVLVQEQQNELRVINYASGSLSDVEKKYSQTEREALAIVWAGERFHMYLYGCDFELMTDHKPLEFIYSPKSKPCARIERWVLRMQPYRYTVTYIPGAKNIADSLSRLLSKYQGQRKPNLDEGNEAYVHAIAIAATPIAMTTREIERESDQDDELRTVRESLITGNWRDAKDYMLVRHELCAIGRLVLRGTKIVIPKQMRVRVLKLAHEGHPGIVVMKQRLREKVWWPGIAKDVENYCKCCHGCQIVSQPTKPEPMKRTELPNSPWEDLAADLLGPLPTGEYIFVLVDYYSRYIEVEIMRNTSSEKITEALYRMFATHGLPVTLRIDNGPQFISKHSRANTSRSS